MCVASQKLLQVRHQYKSSSSDLSHLL
jgi:hypothetical protein